MNIKEYMAEQKAQRNGVSFAFLAERVPTSADSPYRINVARPLKRDETAVLMLCGSGGKGDNIRGYNGYLKQVADFVKQQPELQGKDVRVCTAVCNFGKYHNDRLARELQYFGKSDNNEALSSLSETEKAEILQPAYIRDIFNQAILPRISDCNGTARLPAEQARRYIRQLNVVTHCHGGYVAFQLEKMMADKMTELGYSNREQQSIFNQMLVVNYAPDFPQYQAKSQFVSFESAADSSNKYQTVFKEYLQMKKFDFALLRLPRRLGNIFLCTQIDKRGIEGNPPPVWERRVVSGDDLFISPVDKTPDYAEPEAKKYLGEHDFLGFVPVDNMSRCACKMQMFANNVLKNAILNSLSQTEERQIPLPGIRQLAVENAGQRFDFAKAYLVGHGLLTACSHTNKQKLNDFIWWHQNNRIYLDD